MAITFTWNNPNTEEYTPEEVVIYRALAPFEADALPEPFAVLPPTALSYTDDTAVDGVDYFFRVSFKLGIREMVSRIIEIKAPTTPDIFNQRVIRGGYPYSDYYTYNYADQFVVMDAFESGKWPIAIGENGQFGNWYPLSTKSEDSIGMRIAAMIAIQKFKRSVWLTEEFTLTNPTTLYIFDNTSSVYHGWISAQLSGIPYGSTMTWKEAFDLLANLTNCADIAFNVIHHCRADILMSFTGSRGIPVGAYVSQTSSAIRAIMEFVEGLSQFYFNSFPFRGAGEYMYASPGNRAYDTYSNGLNASGVALIRLFREAFRLWPEIKEAFKCVDQRTPLTYRTAALATVDFLSTAANANYKVDCAQNLVIPTHGSDADAACIGPRGRSLNGELSLYDDMFAASGFGTNTTSGNGWSPSIFFMTKTPNGKDFATVACNVRHNSRALFALANIWNKASAYCPEYTDGLSEVDPLESQVVLRYIPKFGMVDQSQRGTSLQVLTAFDPAKHQSAFHVSSGFPDPALATWGSDTAGMGTIKTNLNMLEYIRSGTSFTIEVFMSDIWNDAATIDAAGMDLIALGGISSGFRFGGVQWWPSYGSSQLVTHASHTANRAYPAFLNSRGKTITTKSAFDQYGGNDFFYHIVLQYDAVRTRFEFFVNGLLVQFWTPFTPTAGLNIPLCFFGSVLSTADQTSSRHYEKNTTAWGEQLVHEIVVTLAKRYNYACFIGKVPFARKRFLA